MAKLDKHGPKFVLIWMVMGMMYFTLEGVWRIPTTGGYANIIMLPIGGLCGALVGGINQVPKFYKLKVLYQSLIGVLIVDTIEFTSGMIVNVWLGLGIWDYSGLPLNICGQICLLYSFLWLLIMPFCIWMEDRLRFIFYHEGSLYSLFSIYVEFFTLK